MKFKHLLLIWLILVVFSSFVSNAEVSGEYINLKSGYGQTPYYCVGAPGPAAGPCLYAGAASQINDSDTGTALGYSNNDAYFEFGYTFPVNYSNIVKFNWYEYRTTGGCKYWKLYKRDADGGTSKVSMTGWEDGTVVYNTDEAESDCSASGWKNVSFEALTTDRIYMQCTAECSGGDFATGVMELDLFTFEEDIYNYTINITDEPNVNLGLYINSTEGYCGYNIVTNPYDSSLNDDLTHYWDLQTSSLADEIGGWTFADSCTSTSAGFYPEGTTNNFCNTANSQLLFDSTYDIPQDRSWSMWINISQTGCDTCQIFWEADYAANIDDLYIRHVNSGTNIGVCSYNAGYICLNNVTYTQNEYTNIVVTRDSTSTKVWSNGNYIGNIANSATGVGSEGEVRIGRGAGSQYPYVTVDELALWDRTITEDEVLDIYNEGVGNFYPNYPINLKDLILQYNPTTLTNTVSQSGTGSVQPFGYLSYYVMGSAEIPTLPDGTLSYIDYWIKKEASPTNDITAYLYEANTSGVPVTKVATSINTINGASVTGSYLPYRFYFSEEEIDSTKNYTIVLNISNEGSLDETNFYRMDSSGSGTRRHYSWNTLATPYWADFDLTDTGHFIVGVNTGTTNCIDFTIRDSYNNSAPYEITQTGEGYQTTSSYPTIQELSMDFNYPTSRIQNDYKVFSGIDITGEYIAENGTYPSDSADLSTTGWTNIYASSLSHYTYDTTEKRIAIDDTSGGDYAIKYVADADTSFTDYWVEFNVSVTDGTATSGSFRFGVTGASQVCTMGYHTAYSGTNWETDDGAAGGDTGVAMGTGFKNIKIHVISGVKCDYYVDNVYLATRSGAPATTFAGVQMYSKDDTEEIKIYDIKVYNSTTRDSTSNANNGISYGAVTFENGKIGEALDFDGTDDYLDSNVNVDSWGLQEQRTVNFWINTTDTSNSILLGVYDGSALFDFQYSGTTLDINWGPLGGSAYDSIRYSSAWVLSEIFNGEWHMLTYVKDDGAGSGTHHLYLDGVEQTPNSTQYSLSSTDTFGNYDIWFGNRNVEGSPTAGYYTDGTYDEIQIFNKALSDTEIQTIYNQTLGVIMMLESGEAPIPENITNSTWNVTSGNIWSGSNSTGWNTGETITFLTDVVSVTVTTNQDTNMSWDLNDWNYTTMVAACPDCKSATTETTDHANTLYKNLTPGLNYMYASFIRTDGTGELENSTSGPLAIYYNPAPYWNQSIENTSVFHDFANFTYISDLTTYAFDDNGNDVNFTIEYENASEVNCEIEGTGGYSELLYYDTLVDTINTCTGVKCSNAWSSGQAIDENWGTYAESSCTGGTCDTLQSFYILDFNKTEGSTGAIMQVSSGYGEGAINYTVPEACFNQYDNYVRFVVGSVTLNFFSKGTYMNCDDGGSWQTVYSDLSETSGTRIYETGIYWSTQPSLKLSSNPEWYGTATCVVGISDDIQSGSNMTFTIEVNETAPYWVADIANITKNHSYSAFTYLTNLSDYVADAEGDTVTITIENENVSEVNCTIDGNNLKIDSPAGWYGNATCAFNITDGILSGSQYILGIEILETAPYWVEYPDNVSRIHDWGGDIPYLNLSSYVADAENDNITMEVAYMNSSEVLCAVGYSVDSYFIAIISAEDWYGNATCIINITDGILVGDNWTFGIEITETTPYWVAPIPNITKNHSYKPFTYLTNLSSYYTDDEGDEVTASIQAENVSEVNCTITGDNLTIDSPTDYYGIATCIIGITDGILIGNNITLQINVSETAPYWIANISNVTLPDTYFYEYLSNLTLYSEDAEGDSITYSIQEESNMDCEIAGNTNLTINTTGSSAGTGYCILGIYDGILYGENQTFGASITSTVSNITYCGNVSSVYFEPNLTTAVINVIKNTTTGNYTIYLTSYNNSVVNQTTCAVNLSTTSWPGGTTQIYVNVNESFPENPIYCGYNASTRVLVSTSPTYLYNVTSGNNAPVSCWGDYINATKNNPFNVSWTGVIIA